MMARTVIKNVVRRHIVKAAGQLTGEVSEEGIQHIITASAVEAAKEIHKLLHGEVTDPRAAFMRRVEIIREGLGVAVKSAPSVALLTGISKSSPFWLFLRILISPSV